MLLAKFQNFSMLVTTTCPLVPLILSRRFHGSDSLSVAALYVECTGAL